MEEKEDMVNHPRHYTQARVMMEPIDVLRYAPFPLGNAIKYVIRAWHKGDALENYLKAEFYIKIVLEDCGEEAYSEFLRRYGKLLAKFVPFNWKVDFRADYLSYFIDDLHSFILKRIKTLREK